jgi:hypothetical protein
MRRGDVWTVAGGKDYAGKARPVVILQDDSFDGTESITICAFTTDDTDAPLFRLSVDGAHESEITLGAGPQTRTQKITDYHVSFTNSTKGFEESTDLRETT